MSWSMKKKPWKFVRYYNPDKDGSKVTRDFLRKAAIDCSQEMLASTKFRVYESDIIPGNNAYILLQYYYNTSTNKSFIQYCVHNYDKYWEVRKFELEQRITNRIRSQFYYDTGIYDEIVNYNQKQITTDSRRKITPYTIGYWKALEGNYELLEDQAQVHHDIHNSYLPPDVLNARLVDFIPVANEIARRYDLLGDENLTRVSKQEYITKYYDLLKETHGEGQAFIDGLEELNREYYPDIYKGENIPAAFEEYWQKYKEFFGVELPRIETIAGKIIITIQSIP